MNADRAEVDRPLSRGHTRVGPAAKVPVRDTTYQRLTSLLRERPEARAPVSSWSGGRRDVHATVHECLCSPDVKFVPCGWSSRPLSS